MLVNEVLGKALNALQDDDEFTEMLHDDKQQQSKSHPLTLALRARKISDWSLLDYLHQRALDNHAFAWQQLQLLELAATRGVITEAQYLRCAKTMQQRHHWATNNCAAFDRGLHADLAHYKLTDKTNTFPPKVFKLLSNRP